MNVRIYQWIPGHGPVTTIDESDPTLGMVEHTWSIGPCTITTARWPMVRDLASYALENDAIRLVCAVVTVDDLVKQAVNNDQFIALAFVLCELDAGGCITWAPQQTLDLGNVKPSMKRTLDREMSRLIKAKGSEQLSL